MHNKTAYQSTIIVAIYQEHNIFDLFFESLMNTIMPGTQIILVNDGSGREMKKKIEAQSKSSYKKASIEVINHENPHGSGSSINEALNLAKGEYIFFLDSDLILQGNWQELTIKTFSSRKDIGVVGATLLYPQTGGVQHCGVVFTESIGRHLFLNALPTSLPKKIFSVQTVIFAMCAIKRQVFETVGFLDEYYFNAYDDLDYQLRAREAGFDIVVNPNIVLYHWEKSNGIHREFNRKNNLGRFWKKWGAKINADLWDFLFSNLKSKLSNEKSSKPTKFIGIDIAEVKPDAKLFWKHLESIEYIDLIDVADFSHRVDMNNGIWLPQVLGKDFYRYKHRILFLTDNFCRLAENKYWFDLRSGIRNDDLIVDLYANIVNFSQLNNSFWPGTKIR